MNEGKLQINFKHFSVELHFMIYATKSVQVHANAEISIFQQQQNSSKFHMNGIRSQWITINNDREIR